MGWWEILVVPGRIEGKVVAVSDSGGLITDITAEQLRGAPTDERTSVRCDEHETRGLFSPDHQEPEATFLAVVRPERTMELEIVGISASAMLGIRVGEKVVVEWTD